MCSYSYTQKHKVEREKTVTCIFSSYVTENIFSYSGKIFFYKYKFGFFI